jgi:hypothetical protein
MKFADDILRASHAPAREIEVRSVELATECQNQFLLLLKPECFARTRWSQSRCLIDLILTKLSAFRVEISGAILISGERLSEVSVIDRHYGYINRMSVGASVELTDSSSTKLRQLVGAPANARILGGHELLARQPSLDAASLNDLWGTRPALRLRSGLYAELHEFDAEPIVVVNGFHPKQLAHFSSPGTRTAVLIAHSDLPWPVLRSHMIGDTFPAKALAGSIRRTVWERRSQFGFEHVDESNNCIHMSSGPFEALAEINNFLCATRQQEFDLESCRQVKHLRTVGWKEDITYLISNPSISTEHGVVSLNDLTEGADGYSAANLAVSFLRQTAGDSLSSPKIDERHSARQTG